MAGGAGPAIPHSPARYPRASSGRVSLPSPAATYAEGTRGLPLPAAPCCCPAGRSSAPQAGADKRLGSGASRGGAPLAGGDDAFASTLQKLSWQRNARVSVLSAVRTFLFFPAAWLKIASSEIHFF